MLSKRFMSANMQKKNADNIEITPSASRIAIVSVIFFAGLVFMFMGGLKALLGLAMLALAASNGQNMVRLRVSTAGLAYESFLKKLTFRTLHADVTLPQQGATIHLKDFNDKFFFFRQDGSMLWPLGGKEILLNINGSDISLGFFEGSEAVTNAQEISTLTGIPVVQ